MIGKFLTIEDMEIGNLNTCRTSSKIIAFLCVGDSLID